VVQVAQIPLLAPAHIDGGVSHVQPARAWKSLADIEKMRALTEFERIRKATTFSHQHPDIEINLCLEGQGAYVCGGRHLPIRAGSLLWIAPGTQHVLEEPSADLDLWVVLTRPRVLEDAAPEAEARRMLGSPFELRELSLPQARQLAAVFEDIRTQLGRNRHVFNKGLAYAVARTCTALRSTAEAPAERSVHPAVLRAARILRENPEARSLEIVARRCGLSLDHLTRVFVAQMGISLSGFRGRVRVEKFLETYGVGRRYSLKEAAHRSGFGSYAQFQRVFKRNCGCSPSEYARSVRPALARVNMSG
jgi:AraC-like DNA-binding protein/mannose-6-phosphate isomerase-like protein (cupin superfamily)